MVRTARRSSRPGHVIRLVVVGLLAAPPALLPAGGAAAAGDVEVVTTFDESLDQNPEGIAVDKERNIFLGMAWRGELWKIPKHSTTPQVFGSVAGVVRVRDHGILGLATDAPGNVYAGVQSADPGANGVWRFDRDTGAETRLPGTQAIPLANGLAFDANDGTLYVTDTKLGAIWRIRAGGSAEVWLQHPLLAGDLSFGVDLGAKGIAFHEGVLYVASTERRMLLKIAVNGDGSPGTPTVAAVLPVPMAIDAVALDIHGAVYLSIICCANDPILRVAPDGTIEEVASGDPLDWPASMAFGTGKGDRQTLYVTNFSVSERYVQPRTGEPFPSCACPDGA